MQTPLLTNFSRGVLSPKFAGRVESEVYHQGAAIIEDFIVNNQGSLQRRPGTYRLWLTGYTFPSATGSATDRFQIDVTGGEKFSLLFLNDDGDTAQFILSKGGENPAHRFFEVTSAGGMTAYNVGLFRLNEFSDDMINFFPEAHSFTTGDTRVIDNAFISNVKDLTFFRLRNANGYEDLVSRCWHRTESRKIAREATVKNPFVKIAPFSPPEYRRQSSTLTHETGFTVYDDEDNFLESMQIRTREVPQFVGQIVTGRYEDSRQVSKLIRGSARTIADESGVISNYGNLVMAVPDEDGVFSFYSHFPNQESRLRLRGTGGTSTWVTNATTNPSAQTVTIPFSSLKEKHGHLWGGITGIEVKRAFVRRDVCILYFLLLCLKRTDWWYYKHEIINVPAGYFDAYKNRVYTVESTVADVVGATYRLYYVDGVAVQIPDDAWEIQTKSGGNITEIKIFNEATINPATGLLPSGSAFYRLERLATDKTTDNIARRAKAWSRTEVEADFPLEYVSETDEWLDSSLGRIQAGQSIVIHNGRLMVIEEANDLSFRVSALRDYANFFEGESEVDAYQFNIETERNETIKWVVPVREGMVVGTDKNEYVILGVESPSSVVSRRYTGMGSSRPYAVRFGDKILFISRDANRIIAYQYSDELSAWFSSDLSSIAEHLFSGGIQSMHYMNDPISTIWVVPEGPNGIYALTWEPTTGVQAWTHHMKDQNVLSAAVATIGDKTALFLAMEREGMVSIEVLDLHPDNINTYTNYVDSAEYLFWRWVDGEANPTGPDLAPITDSSNFTINFGTARWSRFQGQEVVIMVDGQTEKIMIGDDKPHSNTIITIGPYVGATVQFDLVENQMVTVAIGIPFISKLQTLPLLVQSPSGPGVIKNTQVQSVRVRVDASGDFQAGNTADDMSRIELSSDGDMVQLQEGIEEYTGDALVPVTSRWSRRPTVHIESYYANPLNILAIMVDSQVYE